MITIRVLVGKFQADVYLPGQTNLHPAFEGKITRETIESWLLQHTGTQEIRDLQVEGHGRVILPWQDPKSEDKYTIALGTE